MSGTVGDVVFESNDLSDDEGDDGSLSSDNENNGDGKSSSHVFEDPLALVNPTVNLDDVLNAKTIGEAIQLLCPLLPGLPSKQRGKYKQRKFLTDDQREEIMRARNSAIENLETAINTTDNDTGASFPSKIETSSSLADILNPAASIQDTANAKPVSKPVTKPISRRISSSAAIPTAATTGSVTVDHRLDIIVTFLRLLYSVDRDTGRRSTWVDCASPDIVHRTPVAAHKDSSSADATSTSYADFTEGRGHKSLENEAQSTVKFFESMLVRKQCSETHSWASHVAIDGSGVMLSGGKDRISLEYELILKMLPLGSCVADSSHTILVHLQVLLLADFNETGLLSSVEEQFDVLDLIRQRELCKESAGDSGAKKGGEGGPAAADVVAAHESSSASSSSSLSLEKNDEGAADDAAMQSL